MSKSPYRGNPMTWKQAIGTIAAADDALRDQIAQTHTRGKTKAALLHIVTEITGPALRRSGKRRAPRTSPPPVETADDTIAPAAAPRCPIAPPRRKHLRGLDDAQLDHYRLLRRKGYPMAEALPMVQQQQPARQEARA
jgi:hypothetical protein